MNICVFGASITYGSGDTNGGWVQRIRKLLDEKNLSDPDAYFLVYNLGIGGNTTEDLLERFKFELEQRIDEDEKTVIIFSIGGNDSVYLIKEKHNRVPIDKFEKNINKLIFQTRKYTKDITFIGLTPADKKKTSPVPWDANIIYNNIYIERYNSKLKEICQKEKIRFINLYSKLIKMDYKKLLEDGLHPNSNGHEWMAKKIIDSIL